MAVGLLFVILGLWILINGFNGNLAGLIQKTTKINIVPSATDPQAQSVISPGKP